MFNSIRCLVAGDGGVGKTTLISKLTTGVAQLDYIPTILDLYEYLTSSPKLGNIKLQFLDLPGQIELDKIRKYCYQDKTDLILLCFATNSRDSYKNIADYWVKEIGKIKNLARTPILLLGLQSESKNKQVTNQEGNKLARDLGATYLECSAFDNLSVETLKKNILILLSTKQKVKI